MLANDEDQAGDDLALAKKLIAANPVLQERVVVRSMAQLRTATLVYPAMLAFTERCLVNDLGLLWPTESVSDRRDA